MGNSTSHPILLALNELLHSKNLELKKSTLERFLMECDTVAPWFAVSGSLTLSSWEKLGKDLDVAAEHDVLAPGVQPVWMLVRGCLTDQKCTEAIKNGQAALELLQEERSESAASVEATSPIGHTPDLKLKPKQKKERNRFYPGLSDLEDINSSAAPTSTEESESEEEQEAPHRMILESARRSLNKLHLGRKKVSQDYPRTGEVPSPPRIWRLHQLQEEFASTQKFGDRLEQRCLWPIRSSRTHKGTGFMKCWILKL